MKQIGNPCDLFFYYCRFGQNTKILHFIGTAKPWLQNFNSETRKVYIPGGYQHLANFLQFWWDIFCEDVHSRLSSDMVSPAVLEAMLPPQIALNTQHTSSLVPLLPNPEPSP